ncbi:hypothetical protein Back11_12250 [Paenibacillus baekrokdamisoli]|uniref:Uncharacterized protein n=1 Tax=Paenibacillus baekrokdamisoli TaxID=1712516 RepID=A0A3G9IM12_9BACL|nr:hypothetical protein [Paenibacillus baekrokdamisoli]MBB3070530.1 hypothetical protein [Paenibacillus baekrokdamisoli]BBH19880.1 hypothetical protein Back11_12250 [Paenibacillus baekrokdamisoli]
MSGIGTKNSKGGFLVINYINEANELAAVVLNVTLLITAKKVAGKINQTADIRIVNL